MLSSLHEQLTCLKVDELVLQSMPAPTSGMYSEISSLFLPTDFHVVLCVGCMT
uniref:Uncharacterized protein n=1 Tax=Gallus gallus TaxID=9031 RepID=A0A8V0XSF1_CHICK